MASERSRSPGTPEETASIVSAGAGSERSYREDEIARILQRAARLERTKGTIDSPTLTLGEIEAIARESGLDPALIRQAAWEVELERGARLGRALAGASLRQVVERVVEGEIGTDHHEALAMAIRASLSSGPMGRASGAGGGGPWAPRVAVLGRSLTISGWTRSGALEVQVTPKDGQTLLRLESNASPIAGGLFGGIIGGVGGGLGANVAWVLPVVLHLPPVAGLLGAAAVVLGAYWLARSIFVGQVRGLQQRTYALADRLEAKVRELTGRLPAGG